MLIFIKMVFFIFCLLVIGMMSIIGAWYVFALARYQLTRK